MNFDRFKWIVMISLGMTVYGCGDGNPNNTSVSVPASNMIANVRKTLEEFEKTGKVGSNLSSMESDINGIASEDNAKAEALKKLYRELQGLTKPDEIKAKAKEMLGKL